MAKEETKKVTKPLSLAAEAWHNTKDEGDPEFGGSSESEFWGKLQFAADKVVETGTAQTNFEQEVLRLHQEQLAEAKNDGPMAVSAPKAGLASGAMATAAAGSLDAAGQKSPGFSSKSTPKAKAPAKGTKAKPAGKSKKASAKDKQPDNSGHVPTGKEAAAIVREQATAPKHP